MEKKHILIGKQILDVKIAEDKKALLFTTNDGDIVARTDGDCCSDSWVESIELPAKGFPALVLFAGDIQGVEQEDGESEDVDGCEIMSTYGFQIVTDKGYLTIDYRNSSNGYYGGNLAWPEDYFYGGVDGQNKSKEKWMQIKEEVR